MTEITDAFDLFAARHGGTVARVHADICGIVTELCVRIAVNEEEGELIRQCFADAVYHALAGPCGDVPNLDLGPSLERYPEVQEMIERLLRPQ